MASIAVLDPETSRKVDELPWLALITWLDFQMHRCRLVTTLSGSGTTKALERRGAICEIAAPLQLTVWPDLRGFGNIKSTHLGDVVTIHGCDGETLSLL